MVGQVVVLFDEPPESVGAEMLPRHPQLERPEPPRALQRELVPVQRLILRLPHPVVLGLAMERVRAIPLALHQERTTSYGWKNHLCGSIVTESARSEAGHAVGVARARDRTAAAVRRVHVEPELLPLGHVGELCRPGLIEPVLVEPATGAMQNGVQPRRSILGDGGGHGRRRARR